MSFTGFDKKDFQTFEIEGLEERMEAIRERIQPKFQQAGQELADFLSMELGQEMYLHIAKHARRSVNPPNDTWLAIAENKRGYKKHPHFQVGLFDDHVFIWLAFIYELPNKNQIAEEFLQHQEIFRELPGSFVFSPDHMKKEAYSIDELSEENLIRFRDVKKAEFLIGRQFAANDPLVQNGDNFLEEIKKTYQQLLPYFKLGTAVNVKS